jgi:hypothetical protein
MALTVEMVTIDCADPRGLAEFWMKALGYEVTSDHDAFMVLTPPTDGHGPRLSLQKVPEPKIGKNRVHLDISAPAGDRPAEVQRLVGLGAAVVDEHVMPGFAWTVLADPEGTVFCVGAPE